MPLVQKYMPSAWPRSTTLVSAVMMRTPASRRRGDRFDLGAQLLGRQALLEDSDRLSATGGPRDPRSLTVLLTASSRSSRRESAAA